MNQKLQKMSPSAKVLDENQEIKVIMTVVGVVVIYATK
jgi:hypothetical protein